MIQTRKLPRIAYFWPGLPQLWAWGSWAGLAMAVGFTALVNTLILATFVFHEWIPANYILAGYGLTVLIWLVGWLQSRGRVLSDSPDELDTQESPSHGDAANNAGVDGLASTLGEQLFREALQSYLQGDWVATEQRLLKLLKLNERDAEARLMLATLWRRQGRHREALRQLDKLSRLESADLWELEIANERQGNAEQLSGSEQERDKLTNVETNLEVTETPGVADAPTSASEPIAPDRRLAA